MRAWLLLCVALVCLAAAAGAQGFRWVDEKGRVHEGPELPAVEPETAPSVAPEPPRRRSRVSAEGEVDPAWIQGPPRTIETGGSGESMRLALPAPCEPIADDELPKFGSKPNERIFAAFLCQGAFSPDPEVAVVLMRTTESVQPAVAARVIGSLSPRELRTLATESGLERIDKWKLDERNHALWIYGATTQGGGSHPASHSWLPVRHGGLMIGIFHYRRIPDSLQRAIVTAIDGLELSPSLRDPKVVRAASDDSKSAPEGERKEPAPWVLWVALGLGLLLLLWALGFEIWLARQLSDLSTLGSLAYGTAIGASIALNMALHHFAVSIGAVDPVRAADSLPELIGMYTIGPVLLANLLGVIPGMRTRRSQLKALLIILILSAGATLVELGKA